MMPQSNTKKEASKQKIRENKTKFTVTTREDLHQIIQLARKAQPAWAALPLKIRTDYLLTVRDYLVDHIDELCEVISRDTGKARLDSLSTELFNTISATTYYCKKAPEFLKDKKLKPANLLLFNKRSKIVREPYGVIGIISPWNYPFTIPFHDLIRGLLAGNVVILKVARETLDVGEAIKKCFDAAQLPPGVFNYVNMPGSVVGNALLEEGINKLFFTGSVAVGKQLMAKAAETLTPLCLELGGNDPMIVCEDADLHRAANGALWAGFCSTGQSCGGVERLYVHESVYEEFLQILKEKVEALRVGPGLDYEVDMGPMTTAEQVKTVKLHIEDALSRGAKIFAQSPVPSAGDSEKFLPAVVLTDVNHQMLVMKEETFGPVIGVMKFRTVEEAIRLANDSQYGLSASVWSQDPQKAEHIARQIQAGSVNINDHLMSHGMPETPWGGFKESGLGRTHGDQGFLEMTQPKVIIHDILPGVKKDLWWHPYGKSVYRGLIGAIEMLYARSWKRRVIGAFRLLKTIPRIFQR